MGRKSAKERSPAGAELKAFRESFKLNQKEMSDRLGISQATYANYEVSTRHPASLLEALLKMGFRSGQVPQPGPSPSNDSTELAVYKALYARAEEQLKAADEKISYLNERFAKALEECARVKAESTGSLRRERLGTPANTGSRR